MQNSLSKNWQLVAAVTLALTPLSYAQSGKVEAATPSQTAPASAHGMPGKGKSSAIKTPVKVKMVDLNNAGNDELKTLPGIGDELVEKILAGRPYGSKADLVSHGVLLEGPYQSIRKRVFVGPVKKQVANGTKKK
jgi:DNA uptake protein ComE-like DNA-binding protein